MSLTEKIEDGVRVLCLDRPPLNLLDLEEIKVLSNAFAAHEELSPLILTGAGEVFSAGVDTRAFASYGPAERIELAREITRMTSRLLSVAGPTIAAIPGHAIGGGFVLPLCTDYRIATNRQDARYALAEAAAGVPFPSGPTAIVKHELPAPLARRMTLTSRQVALEDIVEANVFDEICPPDALISRAIETAKMLAAQPAFAAVKRQFRGELAARVKAAAEQGDEPGFD